VQDAHQLPGTPLSVHLNATEMLHMLITALCPAIRQLFSRRRDFNLESMASQHHAAVSESIPLRSGGTHPASEEDAIASWPNTQAEPPAKTPGQEQPPAGVLEEALLKALGTLLRGNDGQALSEEALARALQRLALAESAPEECVDAEAAAKAAELRRQEEDAAARAAAVQAAAAAAADAAAARAAAQANVEELEQAAAEMRQALAASVVELQKHQVLAQEQAPAPPAAAAAAAAADPAAMAAAVRHMTPGEIAKSPELQQMLREMADAAVQKGSEPHVRMAVTISKQVRPDLFTRNKEYLQKG
jgi:SWI/SNF-related matrix-associated actin-dependent regulator 1 of chromatin subfamily A